MKKLVSLILLLLLAAAPTAASIGQVLTLDDALARTGQHPEIESWEENREAVIDSIDAIYNKHSIRMSISDRGESPFLSYSHNFDNDKSTLRANTSLSISKSQLFGTQLSASVSHTQVIIGDESADTRWSVSLRQPIFPSPKFNSDLIGLQNLNRNLELLDRDKTRREFLARLNIEEMYRAGQFAQAKVEHAERSEEHTSELQSR